MVSKWVERPILEVLKPNGIKIGPFGSQLKKEMLLSDGVYRVYGQENVYEKDFSLGDRFLTRDHFNHLNSCEIVPGDFVMSTMGTIGKCAIVPANIQRGIMDSHLIRLRFDEKKVNPDYILQLFSDEYHYLSDQTARLAVGGIMDGLSVGIVSRLNVLYPENLEEQERIIEALSDLDDLIADLISRIRKKRDIRLGAMQSLMTGKRRIPGFTRIWREVALGDVCTINAPMVNPQDSRYALLPHIGNESIEKHTGRLLSYNKVIDDNLVSGKYYFTETDVLYGKINPQFGKVVFPQFSGLCSADMYPIACKEEILPQFLKQVLLTYDFLQFTVALSLRSGMPKVNRKEISEYKFYIPEIEEQKTIAKIFMDMDTDIEKLEEKLLKYQRIKQGMMEELLTGKVRLV